VRILLDARRFARHTGGVFDVTVGPLIALWRDAEKRGALPSPAEIAAARARVGSEHFAVDASRGAIALEAGASVDLGGFAKGWTLDRLGELLRDAGVERGLLNFGGSSLLALGSPLDSAFWRIAVDGGPVLALLDTSASISSAYGQVFEVAGSRFAHIVDPRSGWPVQYRQRAIVISPDGATAEAWSKAVAVLPPNESIPLIDQRSRISASVDDLSGTTLESRGFDRYVARGDRE
jgi:thiamine biosynthesis lipoprotein